MQDSVARRERLLERVERATDVPLMIVAAFTIPLFLGPYLWGSEERAVLLWNAIIWGLFALDLSVKVILAPHSIAYLRSPLLDVLIVLVPFIRPLRALRVFLYATRAATGARRILGIDSVVVYATLLCGSCVWRRTCRTQQGRAMVRARLVYCGEAGLLVGSHGQETAARRE